jgi:c-di-GMP-binding flagellar brake protein YcgR
MSSVELAIPRLSQPLKLWEKLELVVGEGDEAGLYWTRIEDFINDGIIVAAPQYIKGQTLLRDGCDVMIIITRQDAAYKCYSRIRSLGSKDDNRYLLSPPRRVDRVQRRSTVRIEMLTRIQYADLVPVMEWEDFEDRCEWHESASVDISAGGVLMKAVSEVGVDQRLLLKIDLFAEIDLPEIVAGVVRRTVEGKQQRLVGVEFITAEALDKIFKAEELQRLPKSVRAFNRRAKDRLTNYIFQRQIEMRQKGLL